MNKTIKAWYFSTDDCILQYGDGRKIKEGVIHKVDEPIKLCEGGLHASLTPFEALYYARGSILWEVELSGKIISGDNKRVATVRKYIKGLNIENYLREFAREEALSVIHLWRAPSIVKEYLETGDLNLRGAARAAAWTAAANAAWNAAWTAAAEAAWNAAWIAAAAAKAARYAAKDASGIRFNDKVEKLFK
ncbi:hypothetical protein LCGC14_1160000 [marine sediment metagenome]|uniref:DUF7666 domain-containing protein n=1 Tax=marine sediment metagenome TaxID=412755 RepID=A0A0F9LSW1_9ZZZZ